MKVLISLLILLYSSFSNSQEYSKIYFPGVSPAAERGMSNSNYEKQLNKEYASTLTEQKLEKKLKNITLTNNNTCSVLTHDETGLIVIHEDSQCKKLKNVKMLMEMGLANASLALMCKNEHDKIELKQIGYICK